jgi:hypothetical protein
MDNLKEDLKELLKPDAVEEAFFILSNCDKKWLDSFYHELNVKKNGNTACMAIDFAKNQLVKSGLIEQKDTDNFGVPEFYA